APYCQASRGSETSTWFTKISLNVNPSKITLTTQTPQLAHPQASQGVEFSLFLELNAKPNLYLKKGLPLKNRGRPRGEV
ncbi:MAG: hypothetical protein WCR70_08920, partial [Sphaerochaetaceae bacterium]